MTSLSRVFRQTHLYRNLLLRYVRHGSVRELVSSRFPFVRADPPAPRVVAIEFTNACDLKCVYCDAQHPAQMRRRGFMTEQTLRNVLSQVRELGVQKLRIIGAGEATIHPRFSQLIRSAAGAAPVVSLTTNGQSLDQDKARTLVESVDIFPVFDDRGSFRRCSSPFKHAGIHWNGDIPLCDASALRLGDPTGLVLGNIDAQPLAAIWRCQILQQYRTGHRQRDFGLATLCRGCGCAWK